eukprot:753523-Hanusia_phi.AAC.12
MMNVFDWGSQTFACRWREQGGRTLAASRPSVVPGSDQMPSGHGCKSGIYSTETSTRGRKQQGKHERERHRISQGQRAAEASESIQHFQQHLSCSCCIVLTPYTDTNHSYRNCDKMKNKRDQTN